MACFSVFSLASQLLCSPQFSCKKYRRKSMIRTPKFRTSCPRHFIGRQRRQNRDSYRSGMFCASLLKLLNVFELTSIQCYRWPIEWERVGDHNSSRTHHSIALNNSFWVNGIVVCCTRSSLFVLVISYLIHKNQNGSCRDWWEESHFFK